MIYHDEIKQDEILGGFQPTVSGSQPKEYYNEEKKVIQETSDDIIQNIDEAGRRLNVAETGTIKVGIAANTGGINRANFSTDIVFWAGATQENRTTAPFRVDAAGNLTATSATIGGSLLDTDVDAAANTGTIAKSANTSRDISNAAYTKIKEFAILVAGSYDVVFTINNTDNNFTTFGQTFKNGVAVGSEQTSATNVDVTFNETISGLVVGDLLQFYGKTTKAGAPWGTVTNFRLRAVIIPNATVNTD